MLIQYAILAGVATPFLGFALYLMQGSIRGGVTKPIALGLVVAVVTAVCAWQVDTLIPAAVTLIAGLLAASIAFYGRGFGEAKPGKALAMARRLERRQQFALVLSLVGIGALVCAANYLEPVAVVFALLVYAGTLCLMALQLGSRFSFLVALALVYTAVWVLGSFSAEGSWTIERWRTSNLGVALVLAGLGWALRGNSRVRHVLGVPALHIAWAASLLSLAPVGALDGVRASACFLIVGLISHLVASRLQTRFHRLAGYWIGACGLTGVLLGNLPATGLPAGSELWLLPLAGCALQGLAVLLKPRRRLQPASAHLKAVRRAGGLHAWGTLVAVWFGISLALPLAFEMPIEPVEVLGRHPLLVVPTGVVILLGILGHFRWMRSYDGGMGWGRRILAFFCLLLLLVAGAVTLTDVHAVRALDVVRAREAAAGRSMDWRELRYPEVPAEENMAVPFIEGLDWVKDVFLPGLRGRPLTEVEQDCRNYNWLVHVGIAKEHPDEATAALEELAPLFEKLEEAAERRAFDQRSVLAADSPLPPPFDRQLAGLLDRRRVFNALSTRAYLHAVAGRDAKAIADITVGMRLSAAIQERNESAIDQMISHALEGVMIREALHAILDLEHIDAHSYRSALEPLLVEVDSGRYLQEVVLRERMYELELSDLAGSDPALLARVLRGAPAAEPEPWFSKESLVPAVMAIFAPIRHILMLNTARASSDVLAHWDEPFHEAFPDWKEREELYPLGGYTTWEGYRRGLAHRRRDLRVSRLALAAAELRQRDQAWPTQLELQAEMGSDYPRDPFSGELLRTELVDGGLRILAAEGTPQMRPVSIGTTDDR